jgi:hypothetical protein
MFEYILRYVASNDDQQLLISDNWNEEAPTEGWTLVNNVFTEGRDWNTFAQADINVPEQFQGKTVRIALRYNCGESGSTWEVKNLVVDKGSGQDGQIDGQGGTDPQPQTDAILSAPFSTALTSNLGDFLTWDEQGNGYNWTYNSTYKCAYITSYDSPSKTNHPANAWLISPVFDLTGVTAAYVRSTTNWPMPLATTTNTAYLSAKASLARELLLVASAGHNCLSHGPCSPASVVQLGATQANWLYPLNTLDRAIFA